MGMEESGKPDMETAAVEAGKILQDIHGGGVPFAPPIKGEIEVSLASDILPSGLGPQDPVLAQLAQQATLILRGLKRIDTLQCPPSCRVDKKVYDKNALDTRLDMAIPAIQGLIAMGNLKMAVVEIANINSVRTFTPTQVAGPCRQEQAFRRTNCVPNPFGGTSCESVPYTYSVCDPGYRIDAYVPDGATVAWAGAVDTTLNNLASFVEAKDKAIAEAAALAALPRDTYLLQAEVASVSSLVNVSLLSDGGPQPVGAGDRRTYHARVDALWRGKDKTASLSLRFKAQTVRDGLLRREVVPRVLSVEAETENGFRIKPRSAILRCDADVIFTVIHPNVFGKNSDLDFPFKLSMKCGAGHMRGLTNDR